MVKRLEPMTDLQGEAEAIEFVQPGEGQKWGSNCCPNYWVEDGDTFFLEVSSQRGNRDKLQEGNSD